MDLILMGLESLKQYTNADGKKQIDGLKDGLKTMGKKTVLVGKVAVSLESIANFQDLDV